MSIDWSAFTPWPALSGGILIGLASVVLVLWNGRIAGISGILGGLLSRVEGDNAWRLAFILGLLAAPWLWAAKHHGSLPQSSFSPASPWEWGQLVVGGLLVGFGTRLANGCTSGHGVCGLARLSLRSLVAVLIFMSAGMATVFMTRHLAGV
ncbi:MAG: YeeE/YedE family protein [Candidatus Accumulibacter sp.]|nr:YeeE/YedE family protein [Candidatus Accumulibacter necessarius]